jgi:hypothetical protein
MYHILRADLVLGTMFRLRCRQRLSIRQEVLVWLRDLYRVMARRMRLLGMSSGMVESSDAIISTVV